MNKKPARIIAVLAFVALVRPCSNALMLLETIWWICFDGMVAPGIRLLQAVSETFGIGAANCGYIAIQWFSAAIPAVLIYRYLSRRDFRQVCDDCAAHKVLSWTLFALFVLFSFFSVSRQVAAATEDGGSIPLCKGKTAVFALESARTIVPPELSHMFHNRTAKATLKPNTMIIKSKGINS